MCLHLVETVCTPVCAYLLSAFVYVRARVNVVRIAMCVHVFVCKYGLMFVRVF